MVKKLIILPILLAFAAPVYAAQPTNVKLNAPGFSLASEKVQSNGTVISEFKSKDSTIKTLGWRGAGTLKVENTDKHIHIEIGENRSKTVEDATRYKKAGRSTVRDLIALGVSPKDAAEYADMDTMSGEQPRSASAMTDVTPQVESNVTPTGTQTVYSSICATITFYSDKVHGYGCSNSFWVAANGSVWKFNSKSKATAFARDYVHRLYALRWALTWGYGNQVTDWVPYNAQGIPGCSTKTLSATFNGFGISVSGGECPRQIDTWLLNSYGSGTQWTGCSQTNQNEGVIGLQESVNGWGATMYHYVSIDVDVICY